MHNLLPGRPYPTSALTCMTMGCSMCERVSTKRLITYTASHKGSRRSTCTHDRWAMTHNTMHAGDVMYTGTKLQGAGETPSYWAAGAYWTFGRTGLANCWRGVNYWGPNWRHHWGPSATAADNRGLEASRNPKTLVRLSPPHLLLQARVRHSCHPQSQTRVRVARLYQGVLDELAGLQDSAISASRAEQHTRAVCRSLCILARLMLLLSLLHSSHVWVLTAFSCCL